MLNIYDMVVRDRDNRYVGVAQMCGIDEGYLSSLLEGKYSQDELTRLMQLVGGVIIATYICDDNSCYGAIHEAVDALERERSTGK